MLCVLTDYVLAHFIQGIGKVLSLQRTVNMKHSLPVLPNKVHQHLQTFSTESISTGCSSLIYFPLKRTFHHIRNIPEMVIKCITVHRQRSTISLTVIFASGFSLSSSNNVLIITSFVKLDIFSPVANSLSYYHRLCHKPI